jgi:hypothetical protein
MGRRSPIFVRHKGARPRISEHYAKLHAVCDDLVLHRGRVQTDVGQIVRGGEPPTAGPIGVDIYLISSTLADFLKPAGYAS